jgi:hypothetical protein
VYNGERCIVDVTYRFDIKKSHPYELRYKVRGGIRYDEALIVSRGASQHPDNDLVNIYREELVDYEDLQTWIEMTRRTARIFIQYLE